MSPLPTKAELEAAPPPEAIAQNDPDPGAPLPPPPLVEDPNAPNAPPPTLGEDADRAVLDDRRRPGSMDRALPPKVVQVNPGAVYAPPPEAFGSSEFPIPDRWRLIQSLGIVKEHFFDPYHQNTFKGDRPLCKADDEEQKAREDAHIPKCITPGFLKGRDWFLELSADSDTVVEPRSFPLPVGVPTTERPGTDDLFGRSSSLLFSQTFIFGASLIKGQTAFKPPEIEYRIGLAMNVNYADVPERGILNIRPTKGTTRADHFLGVQELFVDYHIKNTSDRYDFISLRAGIQPINLDFRGFLFNDNNLAIRFFGDRDDNRLQFNVEGIWRLEKDTNSGLNDLGQSPRDDFILHANVFRQDFPLPGLTSELSATWNINRERDNIHYDSNGFPVRPALIADLRGRNYDAIYVGYGAEGRFGRFNMSFQAYGLFGSDRNNQFSGKPAKIRSFFAAMEPSIDFDWVRVRGAAMYQMGDKSPFSNTETGFDAISENPIFAGADTSYWIRQSVPFIGGPTAVSLTGRNGLLVDLRTSKDEGQSNFINPGEKLLGIGADFDLLPQLRVSANANHLWFDNTTVLQDMRNEGSIPKNIGWDLSTAIIYRPKMTQNLVFRLSGAILQPGNGFRDLFENENRHERYYSVLFNAILAY
ncbi:MAG: hypothetical protein JOY99_06660 [Sphingomonadaceae bacterium]|nr:hypothetical protein [Sphingomonadaceae bacterium]